MSALLERLGIRHAIIGATALGAVEVDVRHGDGDDPPAGVVRLRSRILADRAAG